MSELHCGVNTFEGSTTGEGEHPLPVRAYELAEADAIAKARDLVRHYKALPCPIQCRRQTVLDEYVANRPARVAGFPARKRGNYYIKVVWRYRVVIECKEPSPSPPVSEPPIMEPATPPISTPSVETGQPHTDPCPGPNPPVTHRAGDRVGQAAWFEIRPGDAITSNDGYLQWHDAGPQADLDAWLGDVPCPDGCEPYWDPPPLWKERSADTATGQRVWWELTNDIQAKCRPR